MSAPEIRKLRMEHDAMSSTLSEVENHVSPAVMKGLRRHYMECILAARQERPRRATSRRCDKGGTHVWPNDPERYGRECLKCGVHP